MEDRHRLMDMAWLELLIELYFTKMLRTEAFWRSRCWGGALSAGSCQDTAVCNIVQSETR